MFNQAWQDLWLTLFVILVLIGVFAGQGLVIGFGVMGLLVVGVSWLWNRVSLEEVSYRRDLSQRRAFIGEEFSMSVTLVNSKPVPLGRIEVHDEVPDAFSIPTQEELAAAQWDAVRLERTRPSVTPVGVVHSGGHRARTHRAWLPAAERQA